MRMQLAISKIKLSPKAQLRERECPETIQEYSEALQAGDEFPPVDVFKDKDGLYWLASGFHRTKAHALAKRKTILAEVHDGELRDAILWACGENHKHGLKRSRDDKHRAINTLLDDPEWSKWSDREIAHRCRVSPQTVKAIRVASQMSICSNEQIRSVLCKRGDSVYSQAPKRFADMTDHEQKAATEAADVVHRLSSYRVCPTCGQHWPSRNGAGAA